MNLFQRWWAGTKFRLTDHDIISAWWGGGNYANKAVTYDSVMNIAAAQACVRLIAETIATLPLNLYEGVGEGARIAERHPVQAIISRRPNNFQSDVEFWEGMVSNMAFRGYAPAWKTMNGAGGLAALTPWHPDRCVPYRDENGALWYKVNFPNGAQNPKVSPDKIFIIKGFTDIEDQDRGVSALTYGRQVLGSAIAVDEATARTFQRGLVSAGYFQLENPAIKLDKDKRAQIQKNLKEFADSDDPAKQILLEAGLNWKSMNLTPEDAQMLATRGFNVEEVCRLFRVPPHMIGHTEKSTSWGTGLEQQMIGFINFTLMPYITRIEKAINLRLLSPADATRYYAKFNVNALLRGDMTARSAFYASAAQNGWMSRDEIRALEERNPVGPSKGGDLLTIQSNLAPLDMVRDLAEKQASAPRISAQPADERPQRN